VIEKKGVLVFQTSHTSRIDVREMRGSTISQKILYVIVINSSQLSDFLGMKLKHLEKIESSIYGYATY